MKYESGLFLLSISMMTGIIFTTWKYNILLLIMFTLAWFALFFKREISEASKELKGKV